MRIVAITGINSYFAKTLLPKLEKDPDVEQIIGIDVSPFKGQSSKVVFHQKDIREPELEELFRGADTLVHMAFIVDEIKDKQKTHDINIKGSQQVFQAAAAAGVKKIVYTSSIAAYGSHADNPLRITEDMPLRPNTDSYYSSDKVAVEKFLDEFCSEHPDIIVTRLRPPIIVGPNLSNTLADSYTKESEFVIKGTDNQLQFLHEDDLGEALFICVRRDLNGAFNIAADDTSTTRTIYGMAGIKPKELPVWLLKPLANITFWLGLSDVSQGWISLSQHPVVVNTDKFKQATGWQPKYGTEEAFRSFLDSRVQQ